MQGRYGVLKWPHIDTSAIRFDCIRITLLCRRVLATLCLFALCQGPLLALTRAAGDLAPLSNPDGEINVADVLILQRFVLGTLIPTQEQRLVGDVAPLGNPDGQLNAADLAVLMRAVHGMVSLAPVYLGPDAPALATVPSPTNSNPLSVTGTTGAGLTVRLYVNNQLQASTTSGADGAFSFSAILTDGPNTVHATVWDGENESAMSNTLSVEYVNNQSRTQTGTISNDVVWTPGSTPAPYVVSGGLSVGVGARLIIQPGVEVRFSAGASLNVDGALLVNGTEAQRVVFTSNDSAQAGSWQGIHISSTAAASSINGCVVEYATAAIDLEAGSLSGCSIRDNTTGISIGGTGTPLIQGNDIYRNSTGIIRFPDFMDPALPRPSISGNKIHENATNFVAVPPFMSPPDIVVIDARNNWWGSVDAEAIATSISDYADPAGDFAWADKALVDFSSYHDESGGIYNANQLYIVTEPRVLQAGSSYQVLGDLYVLQGGQLTIQAGSNLSFSFGSQWLIDQTSQVTIGSGVELQFPSGYRLRAEGVLSANGTSEVPVVLTSLNDAPTVWGGINVPTGGVLNLSHSAIRWAQIGVEAAGSSLNIANASITNYAEEGIRLKSAATGTLQTTVIDGGVPTASKTGISLDNASPDLVGNTVRHNQWGIRILNGAAPNIQGNNEISLNDYGVYVTRQSGANPAPVVTGNWIHANSTFNYYATNFQNAAGATLDATLNRWSSDFISEIEAGIYDAQDNPSSSPAVQYRPIDYVMSPPRLNAVPPYTMTASYSVGGIAGPDLNIDVYVNGVLRATTAADANGLFSVAVTLTAGANEIHAIARRVDTGAQSQPSVSAYISLDEVAPAIVVESPRDGVTTNQWSQMIEGYLTEPGTLSINGTVVPVDANNRFSYGPVTLTEGSNAFQLEATDPSGNVRSTTVTVILDTTSELNAGLLTYTDDANGSVTVTGENGSAQPGAEIVLINDRTGETVTGTADANGAFSLQIGAANGDHVSVLTRDELGNMSAWASHGVQSAVAAPALSIAISEPANGATLTSPYTSVSGVVEGPAGVGVMVNGHPAVVSGNRFYANDTRLEPGSNEITVTATQANGTRVQSTITVTRSPGEDFIVNVSPREGAAPLDVHVSIEGLNVQSVHVDYESDGITDDVVTGAAFQGTHRYTDAGVYTIDILVVAVNGTSYHYRPYVVVTSLEAMSAQRRQPYLSMLDRLGAQDIPGALPHIAGESRGRFQTLFESLGGNLAAAASSLGVIQGGVLGGEFTEFYVVRESGGEKRVYPVYLIRCEDGVWRVGSM